MTWPCSPTVNGHDQLAIDTRSVVRRLPRIPMGTFALRRVTASCRKLRLAGLDREGADHLLKADTSPAWTDSMAPGVPPSW